MAIPDILLHNKESNTLAAVVSECGPWPLDVRRRNSVIPQPPGVRLYPLPTKIWLATVHPNTLISLALKRAP